MAERKTETFGQYQEFEGGYPTPQTIRRAYDDSDLVRAIQAYKFFYPTVSFEGTWRGNVAGGAVPEPGIPAS